MRIQVKWLLILLVLTVANVCGAAEGLDQLSACQKALGSGDFTVRTETLFSDRAAEELLAKVRARIEPVLNDHSEISPAQLEEIFNIYMEERLRSLPEAARTSVRDILNRGIKVKTFAQPRFLRSDLSGGAIRILGYTYLSITLPQFLYNSIIDYAVRVHEIEHLIQMNTIGVGSESYLIPNHFPVHRFNLEKGAMRSEGAFLKLFRESMLLASLRSITATSIASNSQNRFAIDMITNALATTTIDQYLRANWSQGRYSRASLIRAQVMSYTIFPGCVVPFLLLCHFFGWAGSP